MSVLTVAAVFLVKRHELGPVAFEFALVNMALSLTAEDVTRLWPRLYPDEAANRDGQPRLINAVACVLLTTSALGVLLIVASFIYGLTQ